jgi:lipid-A-disaccharide synthase
MNAVSWQVARRMVRVPHIALANLIADERVVPELVQDAATPSALAEAVLPLLDDGSPARSRMLDGLGRVRERLGGAGASERVAAMAATLLERRG